MLSGEKLNGVSIFDLITIPFYHQRDIQNSATYLSVLQQLDLTHLIINRHLLDLKTRQELKSSQYPTMWFYIGNDILN